MSNADKAESFIVAVLDDAASFKTALDRLHDAGFTRADISVLDSDE